MRQRVFPEPTPSGNSNSARPAEAQTILCMPMRSGATENYPAAHASSGLEASERRMKLEGEINLAQTKCIQFAYSTVVAGCVYWSVCNDTKEGARENYM